MTTKQYLKALHALGLSRSGADTQAALGLSKRQLIRCANSHREITGPLAILIELMIETGKVRS